MTTLVLNKEVSAEEFNPIKEYLKKNSVAEVMFVRFDGRYHVHLYSEQDVVMARDMFGGLIETEKASV